MVTLKRDMKNLHMMSINLFTILRSLSSSLLSYSFVYSSLIKMERISDDDLLNILKRVGASHVGRFLRFRETSSRNWRLSKASDVLRA